MQILWTFQFTFALLFLLSWNSTAYRFSISSTLDLAPVTRFSALLEDLAIDPCRPLSTSRSLSKNSGKFAISRVACEDWFSVPILLTFLQFSVHRILKIAIYTFWPNIVFSNICKRLRTSHHEKIPTKALSRLLKARKSSLNAYIIV